MLSFPPCQQVCSNTCTHSQSGLGARSIVQSWDDPEIRRAASRSIGGSVLPCLPTQRVVRLKDKSSFHLIVELSHKGKAPVEWVVGHADRWMMGLGGLSAGPGGCK